MLVGRWKKRDTKNIYTQNYKGCLEATQLDNKREYTEKNNFEIDSIKRIIKIA